MPWRRVLANATLGAEVAGVERDAARREPRDRLERFGLAGFERAWPATLSGGMRQRVALLRTFLVPRPVLLLDEPLGALDAITRRSMQEWLQEVWIDDGRTVVLVTHDVEEALLLADRGRRDVGATRVGSSSSSRWTSTAPRRAELVTDAGRSSRRSGRLLGRTRPA